MVVGRAQEVLAEGVAYCLAVILVLVSPSFDAFVERALEEQPNGVFRLLYSFRELESAVSIGLLAWLFHIGAFPGVLPR